MIPQIVACMFVHIQSRVGVYPTSGVPYCIVLLVYLF